MVDSQLFEMRLTKMKQEDKNDFFDRLSKDRMEIAEILKKPSVSGVRESVIDKYSDQAHFVYELLQNADDVGATYVRFILEKERLLFIHNGNRHFSVTNPDTEKEDRSLGELGDLNAITSIGQSSKNGNNAKIGKFGVGFKAVFQYTESPMIFDPNISFKIDNMIVPIKIEDTCPERNDQETCFVFPFNKKEISPQEAYDDISRKIKRLDLPMIFLNNLERISYSDQTNCGEYIEKVIETKCYDNNIEFKRISYIRSDNFTSEATESKMFLFTKITNNNYKVAVIYFLDESNNLVPKEYDAFCFFPTKVYTGLPYAIHAPFLLTDSREGIKAGKKHNIVMINELATLAAQALEYIKKIGIEDGIEYLDANILKIIPYDRSKLASINENEQLSFAPFYDITKEFIRHNAVLPAGDGEYVEGKHAYWSYRVDFSNLVDNILLRDLCDDSNACWVFDGIGFNAYKGYSSSIVDYIKEIVFDSFDDEEFLAKLKEGFIEKQPIEWLLRLYKFLSSSRALVNSASVTSY